MTRVLTALAALLLVGFIAINGAPTANSQTGDGWIQLFDGKTMDGWTPSNDNVNWRVEDGALVADKSKGKGGNHLVTKNAYKDHMIYAEFWTSDDANSGIFVRCDPKQPIGAKVCYEVNIFDTRPDPSLRHRLDRLLHRSGARCRRPAASGIPSKSPRRAATSPCRSTASRPRTSTTVLFDQGHFTLQYGGGVVKFRKVAVKPL